MNEPRERHILHCDMDAFFAAVEQRDHPKLEGRPVIVGGGLQRGVVSACSYEARAFGVHSAMPMAIAIRRCPQAVVLPVRMARYREISRQVFSIFGRFTDRVETLSIDEAFLDVTGCERLFGPPPDIASSLRKMVRTELNLAVSVGIAPNKFLAKLASQRAKPDGVLEVTRSGIDTFLADLPIAALWGVGEATEKRFKNQGVGTVGELRAWSRTRLTTLFGEAGVQLYLLARGIDERPVEISQAIKSIGHEETFSRDLRDQKELRRELCDLAERVALRLREEDLKGKRIVLKVRYEDFTTVTRSKTLGEAVDHGGDIYPVLCQLLERTEAGPRPVRLLGATVAVLQGKDAGQDNLFGSRVDQRKRQALDQAVDSLRRRFGKDPVRRAVLLEQGKKIADSGSGQKGGNSCE